MKFSFRWSFFGEFFTAYIWSVFSCSIIILPAPIIYRFSKKLIHCFNFCLILFIFSIPKATVIFQSTICLTYEFHWFSLFFSPIFVYAIYQNLWFYVSIIYFTIKGNNFNYADICFIIKLLIIFSDLFYTLVIG